jgi:phospholipid/cholesterol/gamma-HCH transport system ATP-binding protein
VKLIRELSDALSLTSIVVSHDVSEVLSIADYVYIIADKRIIAEGTPEQLRHANNPQLRQFLDGAPDGPVPFHYPAMDYQKELLGASD